MSSLVTRIKRTVVFGEGIYSPKSSHWKGECIDNIPDGKGTLYEGDAGFFTEKKVLFNGEMKNGEFHGKGSYTSSDNKFKYTGDYENGKLCGEGIMNYCDDNGFTFSYEGNFKDDMKNGFGILKFLISYDNGSVEDKIIYEGNWKDNVYNGKGKHYFYNDDGKKIGYIDGDWDDKFVNGIIFELNGDVYKKIAEGNMTIPNFLATNISFNLISGVMFNNVMDFSNYYEMGVLQKNVYSIPYKVMEQSVSVIDGIKQYSFYLMSEDNEHLDQSEEAYEWNIVMDEIDGNNHLKLITYESDSFEFRFQYDRNNEENNMFKYRILDLHCIGKFNSLELEYESIVRYDSVLFLDETGDEDIDPYIGKMVKYNLDYVKSSSFPYGNLYKIDDITNPIDDDNCHNYRTEIIADSIGKVTMLTYKFGNIYQEDTSFNGLSYSIINHIIENNRTFKQVIENPHSPIFYDTKNSEYFIVDKKDGVALYHMDKKLCQMHKSGLLEVFDSKMKKIVYPDMKHDDMEMFVSSDILWYCDFVDCEFWMQYGNFFNQSSLKSDHLIIDLRRIVKVNSSSKHLDKPLSSMSQTIGFYGNKNMLASKDCDHYFNGVLSVNKNFIKGTFDKDMKAHGKCDDCGSSTDILYVHSGLYCHGSFVRPYYVGEVNDKMIYNGNGTIFIDGGKVKYVGTFEEGKLYFGKKYVNEMIVYRGGLAEFIPHGEGIEFFPDGTSQAGFFSFGVLKE